MFMRFIFHWFAYIAVINCARIASETKSIIFLFIGSAIAFFVFVIWFPLFIHIPDTENKE